MILQEQDNSIVENRNVNNLGNDGYFASNDSPYNDKTVVDILGQLPGVEYFGEFIEDRRGR